VKLSKDRKIQKLIRHIKTSKIQRPGRLTDLNENVEEKNNCEKDLGRHG